MANIAVISGGMIPYAPVWGGIQRVYYLASHLEKKGHRVVVIFPKGPYIGTSGKEMAFELHPIPFKAKFLQKASENFRNSSIEEKLSSRAKRLMRSFVGNTIRFVDRCLNAEPSPGTGIATNIWNRQAHKEIVEILASKSIQVVIISGPPFSLFKLIPIIKGSCSEVKIIADYRDPWCICINESRRLRTKELNLLEKTQRVVTFSEAFSNDLRNAIPSKRIASIEYVYNGFSESDWKCVEDKFQEEIDSDLLIISHIGTIGKETPGRNPANLIKAFKEFAQHKKGNVKLRFIGAMKDLNSSEESIEIIPRVSHKESLEHMLRSNLLLIIHTNLSTSKYALSGKFFDYVRSGVPIIGIGFNNTVIGNLIEENGFVCNNTSESILEVLEDAYEMWKEGKLLRSMNPKAEISDFSRENQNAKYERIVLSMLEESDEH